MKCRKYSQGAELLELKAQATDKGLGGCGQSRIRYRLGSGGGGEEHHDEYFSTAILFGGDLVVARLRLVLESVWA